LDWDLEGNCGRLGLPLPYLVFFSFVACSEERKHAGSSFLPFSERVSSAVVGVRLGYIIFDPGGTFGREGGKGTIVDAVVFSCCWRIGGGGLATWERLPSSLLRLLSSYQQIPAAVAAPAIERDRPTIPTTTPVTTPALGPSGSVGASVSEFSGGWEPGRVVGSSGDGSLSPVSCKSWISTLAITADPTRHSMITPPPARSETFRRRWRELSFVELTLPLLSVMLAHL
jgi:hypothetical protein